MSRQWQLPYDIPGEVYDRAARIRLALFDVDGVLTDGALYVDDDGRETKRFHVHDGHGLKMLGQVGIEVGIITARASPALEHRAAELGIDHVFTRCTDKLGTARKLASSVGLDLEHCCYTGDDAVDVPLLLECGLAIAVSDANHIARHVAHWVTPSAGGNGAVRDVCEMLIYAQGQFDDLVSAYFRRS